MHAVRLTAFLAAALFSAPALADRALVTDTGLVYAETAGMTVSRLSAGSETIILTEACTAEIPGRGRGMWSWGAQGTTVTVGTYSVRFVADVPMVPLSRCVG